MEAHLTVAAQADDGGAMSPEEAAAVRQWEASGHPPIPLVTDRHGRVQLMTTQLRDVLSGGRPSGARYRHAALAWLEAHCAT